MRAEGSQTKAHPVLKKLVTKKELVEFYDTIEADFKRQLKGLARGYTTGVGARKFEVQGEDAGLVLEEKVRQIQGKAGAAKANKKKSKKAANAVKAGTSRLVAVEENGLLNLGEKESDD